MKWFSESNLKFRKLRQVLKLLVLCSSGPQGAGSLEQRGSECAPFLVLIRHFLVAGARHLPAHSTRSVLLMSQLQPLLRSFVATGWPTSIAHRSLGVSFLWIPVSQPGSSPVNSWRLGPMAPPLTVVPVLAHSRHSAGV